MPEQTSSMIERVFGALATRAIPEPVLAKLVGLFSPRHFHRGAVVVQAGERTSSLQIVIEGVLRLHYTRRDGREFTKGLVRAGQLHAILECVSAGCPSRYTVTAAIPAHLLVADYPAVFALCDEEWSLQIVARTLFEQLALLKTRREESLLMSTASERYSQFLDDFRDIEPRLTDQVIASYLRVAPETLSRLKRARNDQAKSERLSTLDLDQLRPAHSRS
jgi:CRP-like cAMP-binding protein